MKERWKDLGFKDRTQYIMAVLLIISGIVAAFVCILFNAFNISTGVLIYIAQAFITAGGIFGVSIYFKSKLGEFDSRQSKEISDSIEKVITHIDNHFDRNRKHYDKKWDEAVKKIGNDLNENSD